MTTPVKQDGGSFFKDEPVLATGIASSAIAWVLAFLVQDGIITNTQASTLSKALVPIVASAIVMVITFIARHWVVPAWKSFEQYSMTHFGAELSVLEHALTPADFDKVKDMLANGFTELEARLVHKLQASTVIPPAIVSYGGGAGGAGSVGTTVSNVGGQGGSSLPPTQADAEPTVATSSDAESETLSEHPVDSDTPGTGSDSTN